MGPMADLSEPMLTLVQHGNDWHIRGVLTMQSLSAQWRVLEKARPMVEDWQIDMSQVTRIDSAGLAFLLDCVRYAEQHNMRLSIAGMYEQDWFKLMRVHGIESLLVPFIDRYSVKE